MAKYKSIYNKLQQVRKENPNPLLNEIIEEVRVEMVKNANPSSKKKPKPN